MKKVLINYANAYFYKSQKINSQSGLEVGLFDEVISYSPKNIDRNFMSKNKHILQCSRGNGYWLWKPYFIKKTLEQLNEGDFLFYCDSGAYFIKPITSLIDLSLDTNQDIIVFDLQLKESVYTKRDAFILMDCDTPKYSESNQRLGSFSLWRKTKNSMKFLEEYLAYAQDDRIITDLENQCGAPNYPSFKDHRHDQSILSLLSKKYNIEAYRDPSQWGNKVIENYPNSQYKQIIEHTRAKEIPLYRKILNNFKHFLNTKTQKNKLNN
jgi:hypothetical protein